MIIEWCPRNNKHHKEKTRQDKNIEIRWLSLQVWYVRAWSSWKEMEMTLSSSWFKMDDDDDDICKYYFGCDFLDCCPHLYSDNLKCFGCYILWPSSGVPCLSECRNHSTWKIFFKVWQLIKQGIQELWRFYFELWRHCFSCWSIWAASQDW